MQTAFPKPTLLPVSPAPLSLAQSSPSPAQGTPSPAPPRDHYHSSGCYIPRLNLIAQDLSSPGTARFFSAAPPALDLLRDAIISVCAALYPRPGSQPTHTETITLVIREMAGVACTTAGRHARITLSAGYLASLAGDVRAEVVGVIRHEMVHVWQHTGAGTAPSGWVEGVADWVRLRDGLLGRGWRRTGGSWDQGYAPTAMFLLWVDERWEGAVRAVNDALAKAPWDENASWGDAGPVRVLWKRYCAEFGLEEDGADDATPTETCGGDAVRVEVRTNVDVAGKNTKVNVATETHVEVPPKEELPPARVEVSTETRVKVSSQDEAAGTSSPSTPCSTTGSTASSDTAQTSA